MKTKILAAVSIAGMLAFTMTSQAAGGPGGGGAGVGGPSAGGGGAGVGGPSAGGGNAGVGGPSAGGGFGGVGSPSGASPANPPAGRTLLSPSANNNQAAGGTGTNIPGLGTNNLGLATNNLGANTNEFGVGTQQGRNNENNLSPTGRTNATRAIPEEGPTPMPEF